ncbi:MAG: hypothetical protein KGJ93_02000 [Patescibacteria group bacterium]|nr:hypothetical protein [Patescibacteria group bacterium]
MEQRQTENKYPLGDILKSGFIGATIFLLAVLTGNLRLTCGLMGDLSCSTGEILFLAGLAFFAGAFVYLVLTMIINIFQKK